MNYIQIVVYVLQHTCHFPLWWMFDTATLG